MKGGDEKEAFKINGRGARKFGKTTEFSHRLLVASRKELKRWQSWKSNHCIYICGKMVRQYCVRQYVFAILNSLIPFEGEEGKVGTVVSDGNS